MSPTAGESSFPLRLNRRRRGIAGTSAVSLLALLFLLGFGAFRQPSTAHQFRNQSQSCMALDQRDGAVASEAALSTPVLRIWLRVSAPVLVPQPRFLPDRLDPLPKLRHGFERAHSRRGPPHAI